MNTNKIEHLYSGKVRDMYTYGDDHLLIRTSDRISAFDVILPDNILGKGKVLNDLTEFWMKKFEHMLPNHLTGIAPPEKLPFESEGQLCVVKKLTPVKIEAVVRQYLIGSGWKDYQKTGSVCGIKLPEGLRLGDQLPDPIFTPATKADVGDHDENVSFETMTEMLGKDLAEKIRLFSLWMFMTGSNYAYKHGIILADTKFEFGLDKNGELTLMDEVLTPDSSRYWSVREYILRKPDTSPPSFDKQIVRDYLETLDWNKEPPGPTLPIEIVEKTSAKYKEIRDRLLNE